nr:hypothetical protein [Tanacetum cinerariifolium]
GAGRRYQAGRGRPVAGLAVSRAVAQHHRKAQPARLSHHFAGLYGGIAVWQCLQLPPHPLAGLVRYIYVYPARHLGYGSDAGGAASGRPATASYLNGWLLLVTSASVIGLVCGTLMLGLAVAAYRQRLRAAITAPVAA